MVLLAIVWPGEDREPFLCALIEILLFCKASCGTDILLVSCYVLV